MKKLCTVLFSLLLAAVLLPVVLHTASAETTSGTCGENLTWSFDEATGALTITGTGKMDDYNRDNGIDPPWDPFHYQIKTIVLPDGLETIGNEAFMSCTNLESVTIPEGLVRIGDYAFMYCYSLESVTIPDSVDEIGGYAFAFCHTLPEINIPDSVRSIFSGAWRACSSLRSVVIPSTVTYIGHDLFRDCTGLESVSLGSGFYRLVGFYGCEKLKEIVIPSSVTIIDDHAFFECTDLKEVVIPESVTQIYENAFAGCESLENVVYLGTAEEKAKIQIDETNTSLLNAAWQCLESTDGPTAASSDNIGNEWYRNYADVIDSYLYKDDDGRFVRVEYIDGIVRTETYSDTFELLSSGTIEPELPIFGGFFAGKDRYYLIEGQENPEESDETEVIRVIAYTKDWERLSHASLYGANTIVPFFVGSLRCAETDGYLYIRTSHQMYMTSDGLNHQANLSIVVNESSMSIADAQYWIDNNSTTYVSHSFNQFILIDDDDNLVFLDHGDAYPRSAVLFKLPFGEDHSMVRWGDSKGKGLYWFPGEIGDNYTGCALGGLEESDTGYLAVGNLNGLLKDNDPDAVPETWKDCYVRNAFICYIDKSLSDKPTLRYLTDLNAGTLESPAQTGESASVPHLVRFDADRFLVIWNVGEVDDWGWFKPSNQIEYVFVNGKGEPLGPVQRVAGALSDCKPIVVDGKAYWYVTDNSEPTFYCMDGSGAITRHWKTKPYLIGKLTNDGLPCLRWPGIKGTAEYQVYVSDRADGTYTLLGTTTESRYIHETAEVTKTYYYKVTARHANSAVSDSSEVVSITVPKHIDTSIEWNGADVQYKGTTPYVITDYQEQKPRFTVKDEDGNVIDPADYTYTYRENARAGTGYVFVTFQSGIINPCSAFFKIYLPATTETSVENVENGIKIKWAPVKDAAGYVIYRRAWNLIDAGWTTFERWNNTTDLEWTDTKVYAGTRYQYGIKAYFARRTDPVAEAEIGGNVGDNFNLGIVGPLKTTVRITTRKLSSVKAGTKKMTVKWEGSKVFTGYQIQYALDSKFTKSVKVVKITDAKTVKKVIKKLKTGKKYYVRVRSYHVFEGMTYYGQWSNVKSCKVK